MGLAYDAFAFHSSGGYYMKTTNQSQHKNIIGKKVRELRIQKGLTQDQLAAKLEINEIKIDRIVISRIESGNRFVSDYELLEIAKALDVTPNQLLSFE